MSYTSDLRERMLQLAHNPDDHKKVVVDRAKEYEAYILASDDEDEE